MPNQNTPTAALNFTEELEALAKKHNVQRYAFSYFIPENEKTKNIHLVSCTLTDLVQCTTAYNKYILNEIK